MRTAVASILLVLLCCLGSSLSGLVLYENGALVPEDTVEVEAARDLHMKALVEAARTYGRPVLVDGHELDDEELERFLRIRIGGGVGLGGLGIGGGIGIGGLGFGGGIRLGGGGIRGGFGIRG